jgi:hypothetical protein
LYVSQEMDPLPDIPDAGRFLVERLQVQSERDRESAHATHIYRERDDNTEVCNMGALRMES